MEPRKIRIHLRSVIDGDEAQYEYEGEYLRKHGSHNLVYTDYTGNEVTKVALEATDLALLLHRVGFITADMLFDTETDTVVRYEAASLRSGFLLHTDDYRLKEEDGRIRIDLAYVLHDSSGGPEIRSLLTFDITFLEGEL